MNVIEYVVASLGWSLLGFATGWLAASLRTDVSAIKETVLHEPHEENHERLHLPSVDRATRLLGIVVALLAVVTVVQGVVAQRRIADVAECQAEYNDRFAEALQVRSQLADEDREALHNMLLAVYEQRHDSRAERYRTFQQWVETTQANERERADHPVPELPKGDCR